MQNRPEFLFAWFGLHQLGVTVALINTEAVGKALAHAVTLVDSKLLILGQECVGNFQTAADLLADQSVVVVDDAECEDKPLPQGAMAFDSAERVALQEFPRQGLTNQATAAYIYTSGTTGLPKAALISQSKWLSTGRRWIAFADINADDRFYCVLPLYHGSALMSQLSATMAVGGFFFIRRRFSASNFWKDVQSKKLTCFNYVGEVCRYLYNTPECPEEKNHSLRLMTGAGMGRDIWEGFAARFGEHIRILEGWGSTEANCNMTNLDNRVGSCGRLPYKDRSIVRLVRYSVEDDTHILDDNGFMQEAADDQVGELLGLVHTAEGQMVSPFDGYSSKEASDKKLLRDVFQKGDCWWSSGDLMRRDAEDYYYFVDRIGDTFRWKSENVSTTEVAQQLSEYDDAEVINVYGVRVPGAEGRAGMAAVVMQQDKAFDPKRLAEVAIDSLQAYARPLFVRVAEQAEMTGNYKLRKVNLRKEGYDPENFADTLYLLNTATRCYEPYSAELLAELGLQAFAGD
jgi:fatty-acyl-CoA synthase